MNTGCYAAVLLCALLLACKPKAERGTQPAQTNSPFVVSTAERGPLRSFATDSLSESARVTRLVPEDDGDGVAFTFADPAQQISGGLGLIDQQHVHALLVWPDSVTRMWWPSPHQLAFTSTTGDGVHVAVDVHVATLQVVTDTAVPASRPPIVRGQDASRPELARASAYVDSIHFQIEGSSAEHSLLHYSVASLLLTPGDSLAAFYVVATDSTGMRFNPAWYVLDSRSGQVQQVDRLVGRADDMPADAAAWDRLDQFFYAKENMLYEAQIRR